MLEVLILAALGVWLALALRSCLRRRGKGCGGCDGCCDRCGGACRSAAADIPHIVGKTAPAECSAGALLKRTPAGCLRWGFASCVQQHRAVRQDKPVCGGGAQICRQGCHAVDGLPLQQPFRRYQ